MADNSKKVSELATIANVASTDRILVLRSPSGNSSVRTVDFSVLSANLIVSSTIPATSSSNGLPGTIAHDVDWLYVCTSPNTWKRAALTSF